MDWLARTHARGYYSSVAPQSEKKRVAASSGRDARNRQRLTRDTILSKGEKRHDDRLGNERKSTGGTPERSFERAPARRPEHDRRRRQVDRQPGARRA